MTSSKNKYSINIKRLNAVKNPCIQPFVLVLGTFSNERNINYKVALAISISNLRTSQFLLSLTLT